MKCSSRPTLFSAFWLALNLCLFGPAQGPRRLTVQVVISLLLLLSTGREALAQGTFTSTGNMVTGRYNHTATRLADGRVLVAGGYVGTSGGDQTAAAELYDPLSGTWSATGSMTTERFSHTATLLPNGKVLVTGGHVSGTTISSAEIYDPASGAWSPTAAMSTARSAHTATLLTSGPHAGKVLVAGGENSSGPLRTAELYDPSSAAWSPTGMLSGPRSEHGATLLPNGRVLVAGGFGDIVGGVIVATASAELYDPSAGSWSATGSMSTSRRAGTYTLLADGKVLAAGGQDPAFSSATGLSSAEVYDPIPGVWITVGNMSSIRWSQTATLLWNGQVLVAGGLERNGNLAFPAYTSAELYNPAAGTWSSTASMSTPRVLHTATALANGAVLVAGGLQDAGFQFTSSAEIFTMTPVVIPVAIDIKPGSFPNSINLRSGGTVPVAILSTTTFDARTVDPTTVTLAGAPVRLRGNGSPMASFEDVNGDGLLDLVVHVTTQALQLSQTDTVAVLEGKTFDGTHIRGQDSVQIVP